MKKAILSSIADKMNTQDVGFSIGEPDSPTDGRGTPSRFLNSHAHSRSSSWSFTGSTRPGATDLGASLAAINPIRSVIREFVPSLNPTNETVTSPPSRSESQLSMRSLMRESEGATPLNHVTQSRGDTPPTTVNSANSLSSEDFRDHPFANNVPTNISNGNIDVDGGTIELSEGFRWIEQNMFFVTLLLIRYSWMHKSGDY